MEDWSHWLVEFEEPLEYVEFIELVEFGGIEEYVEFSESGELENL